MKFRPRLSAMLCAAVSLVSLPGSPARAQCANVLPSTAPSGIITLAMVTMNRLGVASYAAQVLTFKPASFRRPGFPAFPARYVTVAPAQQVFSDRWSGSQNFDHSQADQVTLSFTTGNAATGTIVLVSHHNGTSTFPLTCSSTGIMHGSTPDVDYLFFITLTPPIQ